MVLDTSQTYAMIKLEAVDTSWNVGNSDELSVIGYLSIVSNPECGPMPPEMQGWISLLGKISFLEVLRI